MGKLSKSEIVACYGMGTDAIDLGYARSKGARATDTPSAAEF